MLLAEQGGLRVGFFCMEDCSMASDVNLVVIEGRVVSDLETKVTLGNSSLTTFRIANHRWIPGNEGREGREETNFLAVSCWGNTADRVAQRVSKGCKVVIKGRWQVRQWQDAESGQQREGHELVADDVAVTHEPRGAER